jgi:hypothetical protein
MGFLKFIGRLGAVGGTARWAARGYKLFRLQNSGPETTDTDIFRQLLCSRYRNRKDAPKRDYLLSQSETLEGLVGLVIEILKVEANFHDNTGGIIYEFVEIIDEEITKQGIGVSARYGRLSRTGQYSAQATTPPNWP